MKNSCYILGDCRDIIPTLGNDIKAVITSPPYFNLRAMGVLNEIGVEETLAEYLQNLIGVFTLIRPKLKKDGTVWVNMGDTYSKRGISGFDAINPRASSKKTHIHRKIQKGYKPKDLIGVPWLFAFEMIKAGFYLRSDIIWHKPNPMPESVKDRPTRSHEYFFLFSKSEKYFYNNNAVKVPTKEASHLRAKYGGSAKVSEKRNLRDVWTVPTNSKNRTSHCSTFPKDLIRPAILASTKEGEIVLDPFCGTGTTGEVCSELGRGFIGVDISPEAHSIKKKGG